MGSVQVSICKLFVLSLCFIATTCQNDSPKLPLCVTCNCVFKSNALPAKVTCDKDVKSIIYSEKAWINSANNQSYAYSEITLFNQNFIQLNYTFPSSNLTYLNLAYSDIYKITDSVFKNLQNMKVLILSYNDLELIMPDAFKGLYMEERLMPLKSLKVLKLDHNRLHTLKQDIFEHTSDVEILDLSYNPLEMIDHHTLLAIDSLVFLKELYLGHTKIKTLPNQMMHSPKYLSILDLSGNPINKIPETLAESHNLTKLYLNETSFVNMTKENGFPYIPSLTVLHMSGLKELERIEKEALSGLTNLKDLVINDNIKLSYLDDFALANINENGGAVWPMIEKLHLSNNKLSYLDINFLARWDYLTDLDLTENPWTCECENQWMVDELTPLYLGINKESADRMVCGAPIEMVGYSFVALKQREYQMRCLDIYGAKPENDAFILIGVLMGVLLALPLILFLIFAYQRRWFGFFNMCDKSPAAYSRRFYDSTPKDDDF